MNCIFSKWKCTGLLGLFFSSMGCTPYILLPGEVAKIKTDTTAIRTLQEETMGTLSNSARQQAESVQQMNTTVAILRGRMDSLEESLHILQQQLSDMMQILARVSPTQPPAFSSAHASPPRSEPVRQEVSSHLPSPIPEPEKPPAFDSGLDSPPPARELGPSSQPPSAMPPKGDAVSLYGAAYGKFREGDFPAAIEGFQWVVEYHPESDLADNALFWIGESYIQMNRLSAAEKAFRDTITLYPEANKVPDAMYKLGDVLLTLNRRDEAIGIWRELISRFPNEQASMKARQRLQSL